MVTEKRIVRGYKVKPSVYKKAMARAKKEKGKLANLMENVALAYANGLSIKAIRTKENGGTALDAFSLNFSVYLANIDK
jgi:hypothetical protein